MGTSEDGHIPTSTAAPAGRTHRMPSRTAAGEPEQSMNASTSAASCSRLDEDVSTTDVAPIVSRRALRAGTGSLTMTSVAPAARATRVTTAPIGPAPATATRAPTVISALRQAQSPTESGSQRAPAS